MTTKRHPPMPISLPPCQINSRRYWIILPVSARNYATFTSQLLKKPGTVGRKIGQGNNRGRGPIAGRGPRKKAFEEDKAWSKRGEYSAKKDSTRALRPKDL